MSPESTPAPTDQPRIEVPGLVPDDAPYKEFVRPNNLMPVDQLPKIDHSEAPEFKPGSEASPVAQDGQELYPNDRVVNSPAPDTIPKII